MIIFIIDGNESLNHAVYNSAYHVSQNLWYCLQLSLVLSRMLGKNLKIYTFEKLEPKGIWPCCLIND